MSSTTSPTAMSQITPTAASASASFPAGKPSPSSLSAEGIGSSASLSLLASSRIDETATDAAAAVFSSPSISSAAAAFASMSLISSSTSSGAISSPSSSSAAAVFPSMPILSSSPTTASSSSSAEAVRLKSPWPSRFPPVFASSLSPNSSPTAASAGSSPGSSSSSSSSAGSVGAASGSSTESSPDSTRTGSSSSSARSLGAVSIDSSSPGTRSPRSPVRFCVPVRSVAGLQTAFNEHAGDLDGVIEIDILSIERLDAAVQMQCLIDLLPPHRMCEKKERVANLRRVASALMGMCQLLSNAITDDVPGIQFGEDEMDWMSEELGALGEAESATDRVNQIANKAETIIAIGRALIDEQENEHTLQDTIKVLMDGQQHETGSVSDTLQDMMKALKQEIEKVLTSQVYFI